MVPYPLLRVQITTAAVSIDVQEKYFYLCYYYYYLTTTPPTPTTTTTVGQYPSHQQGYRSTSPALHTLRGTAGAARHGHPPVQDPGSY